MGFFDCGPALHLACVQAERASCVWVCEFIVRAALNQVLQVRCSLMELGPMPETQGWCMCPLRGVVCMKYDPVGHVHHIKWLGRVSSCLSLTVTLITRSKHGAHAVSHILFMPQGITIMSAHAAVPHAPARLRAKRNPRDGVVELSPRPGQVRGRPCVCFWSWVP